MGFLIPLLGQGKVGLDCTFLYSPFPVFTSQEGPVQRLLPPTITTTCRSLKETRQASAGHRVSAAGKRTVLQDYASADANFFKLHAGG